MPYVPVPKDLTRVKSKLAFNLTKRQLLCFGAGGLVGIPTYIFTRSSIGNEAAAMLMIVLMLPFFAFGIFEKDGQPLEKVLGHFIRARFLYPRTRPYRTENLYAVLERQNRQEVSRFGTKKRTGKNSGKRKKLAPRRTGRTKKRRPPRS